MQRPQLLLDDGRSPWVGCSSPPWGTPRFGQRAKLRAGTAAKSNPLSIKCCEVAMQIALVLYPKFTVLDIIGPFQALVDVPGHDVVFVGAGSGAGDRSHWSLSACRVCLVRRGAFA